MFRRWQERRLERRKRRFVKRVAPLLAEGEAMKASMMVYVAKDDVEAGRIWPEEQLRAAYSEQTDEELRSFIAAEEAGLTLYARDRGIPRERWEMDPVLAEMLRRKRIAEDVLESR